MCKVLICWRFIPAKPTVNWRLACGCFGSQYLWDNDGTKTGQRKKLGCGTVATKDSSSLPLRISWRGNPWFPMLQASVLEWFFRYTWKSTFVCVSGTLQGILSFNLYTNSMKYLQVQLPFPIRQERHSKVKWSIYNTLVVSRTEVFTQASQVQNLSI